MNKFIKLCLVFAVFACAVEGKPQFTNPFGSMMGGSGNQVSSMFSNGMPPGMTNGFSAFTGNNSSVPDFASWIPPMGGSGGNSTTTAPEAATTAAAAETAAPVDATQKPE